MAKPPATRSTMTSLNLYAPLHKDLPITHDLTYFEETAILPLPHVGVLMHFVARNGIDPPIDASGGGDSYTAIFAQLTFSLVEEQHGTINLLIKPSEVRFAFLLEEELQLA